MLVLGLVLLIIGVVVGSSLLWILGLILAIVGAVLMLGSGSGAAWGRRWY